MKMKILILGAGGNICEHPWFKKDPSWAHLTHAVIGGKIACRISGKYLCYDTSLEDQAGLPTCPACAKKTQKARTN